METVLSSTQPFPLGTVLWFGSLVAIVGSFVYGARAVYRRWRTFGLAAMWLSATAIYAYGSFRAECSRPVTCDVGPDPFSFHYLVTVAPAYAIVAGTAFATVSVLTMLQARRVPSGARPAVTVVLAAGLATWLATRLLVYAV